MPFYACSICIGNCIGLFTLVFVKGHSNYSFLQQQMLFSHFCQSSNIVFLSCHSKSSKLKKGSTKQEKGNQTSKRTAKVKKNGENRTSSTERTSITLNFNIYFIKLYFYNVITIQNFVEIQINIKFGFTMSLGFGMRPTSLNSEESWKNWVSIRSHFECESLTICNDRRKHLNGELIGSYKLARKWWIWIIHSCNKSFHFN